MFGTGIQSDSAMVTCSDSLWITVAMNPGESSSCNTAPAGSALKKTDGWMFGRSEHETQGFAASFCVVLWECVLLYLSSEV